jgi:hypothetical protein
VCSPTDQCPDAGMRGPLPQLASHVGAPQSGESASAWRRPGRRGRRTIPEGRNEPGEALQGGVGASREVW